jgi:hypothetical protein
MKRLSGWRAIGVRIAVNCAGLKARQHKAWAGRPSAFRPREYHTPQVGLKGRQRVISAHDILWRPDRPHQQTLLKPGLKPRPLCYRAFSPFPCLDNLEPVPQGTIGTGSNLTPMGWKPPLPKAACTSFSDFPITTTAKNSSARIPLPSPHIQF